MSTNRDNQILATTVILVLILVTIQSTYNIIEVSKFQSKEKIISSSQTTRESDNLFSGNAGYSDAQVSMCINVAPIIAYDCNLTNAALDTSITYNCTLTAIDPNGGIIAFTSRWITSPTIFNITSDGSINFKPTKEAVGHINQVRINVSDDSGCSNNITYRDFNITVTGVNRAPIFFQTISNQKMSKGANTYFYLSDHFIDPDGDELIYISMILTGSSVEIIDPQFPASNVEVKAKGCGNTTVQYIAIDPFGLQNQSNIVTYEVQCSETNTQSSNNGENLNTNRNGRGSGDYSICKPDWRCNAWSQCRYDNRSYRKCMDYNACTTKYIEYFTQNCTYLGEGPCIEKWECNEWDLCRDNVHTRICLDLQNCGTNTTKPLESENCSSVPTCFNGIQDQGETGIDCGGPCTACRVIENPTRTANYSIITILIITLITGLIGMLTYMLRSKIAAAYAALMSRKRRIKRKVYINNKQKEKLLQLVNIIQARLDEHQVDYAIDEISIFIRNYFKQLLAIEGLDKQELIAKIVKLKDKELEKILVMFYAKIINTIHLRNKGVEITETEIQALIDEILHEIYLIAEFTDQEAINAIKDRTTDSEVLLDMIYNKLSNIYIALKFGELLLAKGVYKEILKDYDKLSTKDKTIPYTDIIRAFHAIDYLEKQYEKQKEK